MKGAVRVAANLQWWVKSKGPDLRPVVGAIMRPCGLGSTGTFAAVGLHKTFKRPGRQRDSDCRR
jgi:hypothetical protein